MFTKALALAAFLVAVFALYHAMLAGQVRDDLHFVVAEFVAPDGKVEFQVTKLDVINALIAQALNDAAKAERAGPTPGRLTPPAEGR